MKRSPLKEPLQIGKILETIFKKKGFGKKIAEHHLFEIWNEAVGETISDNATPVKVFGNTLVIRAKNSAWAQELSFMKEEILKKIREKMPNLNIKEIKFTAGKF